MKKHGKILILMSLLLIAALVLCACESCWLTGSITINGDGSGERHISIHIPRLKTDGTESPSYYHLKKHGDDLSAWVEARYAQHNPGTAAWLNASVHPEAAEEILTLSFPFANYDEYIERLKVLTAGKNSFNVPQLEAVNGKVARYTEDGTVLTAVFRTLESWVYEDDTVFDLDARKPDGTRMNTEYSLGQVQMSSLAALDRTMEAGLTVVADGGKPVALRMMQGSYRYAAEGYEDVENPMLTAVPAPEWTAMFERYNNVGNQWLGADGIFGIALDGKDAFGSSTEDTDTFFIFSDTVIAPSDEKGHKLPFQPFYMPNHSAAVLRGNQPIKDNITFYWGKDGACPTTPTDLQADETKNLVQRKKWFGDGVVIGNNLYMFCFTPYDLTLKESDLVTFPIVDGKPDFAAYTIQEEIPELRYTDPATEQYVIFGFAVCAMTETAGVENPDGYIYLYGKWSSNKEVSVARILEGDFPDFTKLTFWDGKGWSENIADSIKIPTLNGVSEEFSITPVTVGPHKGKFIAVYMEDSTSSHIMYAFSDTPWGPFSEPQLLYTAPEASDPWYQEHKVWTYMAKAYPHLSHGDQLLVSYNTNTQEFALVDNPTYHPRFIWVDLDPLNDYATATDLDISTATDADIAD